MTLLLLAALSFAQEAAEDGRETSDRPLAIPLDSAPPPSPEGAPSRNDWADEQYQSMALSIRNVSEFYSTPGTVTSWGWGWGRVGVISPPVVYRTDDWAVFRGPVRIDVPSFLDLTGDEPARMALEHQIQRSRSAAQGLYGAAVVGAVAGVGGLVGMGNARTVQQYATWSQVTTGGVIALIGGAIGGSFPAAKARHLALRPAETLSLDEATERVTAYNANLRTSMTPSR